MRNFLSLRFPFIIQASSCSWCLFSTLGSFFAKVKQSSVCLAELPINCHFVVVQMLSRVRLFVTPSTAAHQASLSFTISQSMFKLMSTESVVPSKHLVLLSPSPSAFSLSQHQILFKWVSYLHQVAKVLELQLQHQSFQWIFRTDLL